MSAIKRAILYLFRKRARTMILLLILFAMGLMMLVGLSVRASAEKAIADVKATYATSFILTTKWGVSGDRLFERERDENGEMIRKNKVNMLDRKELDALLCMDEVAGSFSYAGTQTCYTGLDLVVGGYTNSVQQYEESLRQGEKISEQELNVSAAYSKACGFILCSETKWQPMFQNGAVSLVAGRHLTLDDAGKCVISQTLAQKNGLAPGDNISAQNYDFITGELYGSKYDLEIVGIFKSNFRQDLSSWTAEPDILDNQIFAPLVMDDWGYNEYKDFYGGERLSPKSDEAYGGVTIYLKNPESMDAVIERIQSTNIVDWEYHEIQVNDEDYATVAAPLQTMSGIATALIVLMALSSLIVLSLILMLWTKTRRSELGVFASVGLQKKSILGQFLIECLLICMVAFLLAGVSAAPVTQTVGAALESSLSPAGTEEPYQAVLQEGTWDLKVTKSATEKINLTYPVETEKTFLVLLSMTAICCISVMIAAQPLLRLSPRKLLLRR